MVQSMSDDFVVEVSLMVQIFLSTEGAQCVHSMEGFSYAKGFCQRFYIR